MDRHRLRSRRFYQGSTGQRGASRRHMEGSTRHRTMQHCSHPTGCRQLHIRKYPSQYRQWTTIEYIESNEPPRHQWPNASRYGNNSRQCYPSEYRQKPHTPQTLGGLQLQQRNHSSQYRQCITTEQTDSNEPPRYTWPAALRGGDNSRQWYSSEYRQQTHILSTLNRASIWKVHGLDDIANRRSGGRGIRFPSNNTIEFSFPFKVGEEVRNYIRAALGQVTEWYNEGQAKQATGAPRMEIISAVELDNYGWIMQTLERVGPECSVHCAVHSPTQDEGAEGG